MRVRKLSYCKRVKKNILSCLKRVRLMKLDTFCYLESDWLIQSRMMQWRLISDKRRSVFFVF